MTSIKSDSKAIVEEISFFLKDISAMLKKAIEGIQERELNWRPSPNSNSIGNLLKHIMGAEAFWIHHVVGGAKTHRIRAKEFEKQDFQFRVLFEEYSRVKLLTNNILSRLVDGDLTTRRTVWSERMNQRREVSVFWCLMHVIEHSALHIGQIFYIRKMFADS